MLAGEEAGPAKMAKAQELGIPIINEDDFIQMIRDSTNKKPKEKEMKKEKSPSRKPINNKKDSKEINGVSKKTNSDTTTNTKKSQEDKTKHEKTNGYGSKAKKSKSPEKVETVVKKEIKIESEKVKKDNLISGQFLLNFIFCGYRSVKDVSTIIIIFFAEGKSDYSKSSTGPMHMMWVDKYKPQNLKQIIGQHGDASNVKK